MNKLLAAAQVLLCIICCNPKGHAQNVGIPTVPTPQVASFPRYDNIGGVKPTQGANTQVQMGGTASSVINSQNQFLRQPGNQNQQQQLEDIRKDVEDLDKGNAQREYLQATKIYRDAYSKLLQLNPENFSLADAVFITENAFYNNTISYAQYSNAIHHRVNLVRQILKREKLDTSNQLALNYGIQQLYQRDNGYYFADRNTTMNVPKLKYDFDDFMGDKDWSKMFVSKLIATNSGQCHSMPLLYLMIAQQLKAKAWLSISPQHSFIQFPDDNGNLLFYETTNGNIVSAQWMIQSGYINATAIKNKTFLDTFSQKQLWVYCLSDLLMGYMDKFGYDEFATQMRKKIEQLEPKNLTALIIDENEITKRTMRMIRAAGVKGVDDLPNHPNEYAAYKEMHAAYAKIDGTGYQDMPKEAYERWLKTIEDEKTKQENQEINRLISEQLKKAKVTIQIKKQ
jgi:hypothetical protein